MDVKRLLDDVGLEFRRKFWAGDESSESLPCRRHLSERVNEVTHRESRRKALGLSVGAPKFVHKLGVKKKPAKEPKKNY